MPNLWPFATKEESSYEVSASVPVGFGSGYIQQPDYNYEAYAKQGYAKDELVYACIRELTTASTEPNYKVLLPSSGEPIEAPDTNPIYRLLHYPNPNQDLFDLLEQMIVHLNVSGNAYLFKTRDQRGRMIEMHLLRPDRVSIKSDANHGVMLYEYDLNGTTYDISADDISHLKYTNPTNDLYGLSPLTVLAKTINLDLSQLSFAHAYFANAGVPSGMLKVKRKIQNDEQANTIRQRWRSTFGGPNNFHRIAVLDEDATYEAVGAGNLNEMAFPELRDTVESRICMAFGVPPILIGSVLGLNRSTYSNYKEARASFQTETMIPLTNKIVRFLNHCFSYEYKGAGYVEADFTQIAALTEDQTSITDRIIRQWDAGLISLNEARAAMSLDPLQGGEIRRLPLNVLELSSDQVEITAPPGISPTEQLQLKAVPSELLPDSPYKPLGGQPDAEALATLMGELRIEEIDLLEPKLQRFFNQMQNRVDGVLGRYMANESDETKVPSLDPRALISLIAPELLPAEANVDLMSILQLGYHRMTKKTWGLLRDKSRLSAVQFNEKLGSVQHVIQRAASSTDEIIGYTQRRINQNVALAIERNYTIQQLANGVADDSFKGIRSIVKDTYKGRAHTIARTEMGKAQNGATIAYAKEAGEEYLQAYDPDGDASDNYIAPGDPYGRTCAQRHLQMYHVDEAYDIVDHVNGSLSWSPAPEDYRAPNLLGTNTEETKTTLGVTHAV